MNCDEVQNKPQDGHFLIGRPAYEVSGMEVHDTITNLTWFRKPGSPDSHETAVDHCDVLPGDYRLPTRIELISLLDFRANSSVHIDRTAFPDVEATPYWTSSQYQPNGQNYWTVSFCPMCMSEYSVISEYLGNPAGILCVKSASEPYHSGPFMMGGKEKAFLVDIRTGLMWITKPIRKQMDWIGALEACKEAPDGAYGDFRMPNAKELATIVIDANAENPAPSIQSDFDIMNNETLWSSTPTSTPGNFLTLNSMGTSMRRQPGSLTYLSALCVRGPD